MTRHVPLPDHVLANMRARHQARNQPRQCAGDHGRCRRPAQHRCARYGGAWCTEHWKQLDLTTPTPDPTLTLDALRARSGFTDLAGQALAETVIDSRARDSGRRVPGWRRNAARDDSPLTDIAQATDDATRARFLDVIGSFARTGEPFSANDVRHLLPDLPASRTGALWNAAIRAHQLVEVGRVRSTDPNTNGHRIPLWRAT